MKDLLRSCYSDINRCPSASNAFSELKKIELRKITMAQVESSEEFSDVRQLLCGLLDRRLKHMEDMYVRKDRHVRGEDRLKKKKIVRLNNAINSWVFTGGSCCHSIVVMYDETELSSM